MFQVIFNPAQFEQALARGGVMLTFWGMPGCGACQETKPVVRRFAIKSGINAYELNVNALGELADQHRIQATPTLILFFGGKKVARRTGSLSEEALAKWVEKHGSAK